MKYYMEDSLFKKIYNLIKKRFKLIRYYAVKGWNDEKRKDKCPNCGYSIISYFRMLELDTTFRVCPVCTYICRKSDNKVYFEGIPVSMQKRKENERG